jgi:hypothetical protein
MHIPTRPITIEHDVVIVKGTMPYAIPNVNHVQRQGALAFAYRRTKGNDKNLRVATVYEDDLGHKRVVVFLVEDGGGPITKPVNLKSAPLGFYAQDSIMRWMDEEYFKGHLVDGQSYTFQRYGITLVDAAEADIISKCLLFVGEGVGRRY